MAGWGASGLQEEGPEQGAHDAAQLAAGTLLHGLDHGGAYLGLVAHIHLAPSLMMLPMTGTLSRPRLSMRALT